MEFNRAVRQRGMSLIEMMVVVTIIAILAGILIPTISKAQSRAAAVKCMGTAKSLATTLRTYTSTWEGWSPPVADSYLVKQLGYRLSTDLGYIAADGVNWYNPTTLPANASEKYAASVKDMRCSVDKSPVPTRHGIPSSYIVSSSFQGTNTSDLVTDASMTIMIAERGRRHEGSTGPQGHFIFSDLHGTLGHRVGQTSVVPGLYLRAWNTNNANYDTAAESLLTGQVYDLPWTGQMVGGDALWCSFVDRLVFANPGPWNNNWNLAVQQASGAYTAGSLPNTVLFSFPNTYTFRWDGFIKFPEAEEVDYPVKYRIFPYLAARNQSGIMMLTVDATGTSIPGPDPTFTATAVQPTNPPTPVYAEISVDKTTVNQFYPFRLVVRGATYNGYWALLWTRLNNINKVDPNFRNLPLTTANLYYVPQ